MNASMQILSAPVTEFMACLQAAFPHLRGRLTRAETGQWISGEANSALVAKMLAEIQRQTPEAGRHYWSVHVWSMLLWQPAALTICAAELSCAELDLNRLGQNISGAAVAGFNLPAAAFASAPHLCVQQVRQRNGTALKEFSDDLLTQLSQQIRINPVLAQRLLADRVLSIVLHIQNQHPQTSNDQTREHATQWLVALGLEGASALLEVTDQHGQERLMLNRKGCCQYFRCAQGEVCATCPRLKLADRVQRMRQRWSEDA